MADCAYLSHSDLAMNMATQESSNPNTGTPSTTNKNSCAPPLPVATVSGEDTIIIFDWDDTLLSSSWLQSRGLRLGCDVPSEAADQLRVLETAVIKLLNKALQFGEVYLVTNAEDGWIELSAQTFMPGVLSLLPKVHIVSARSSYQDRFPDQPSQWKVEAFRNGLEQAFQDRVIFEEKSAKSEEAVRNVISLGDSMHERLALKRVTQNMPNTYSKSVKFVEHPTIEQLEREITIINSSFDYLCTYGGDLDLMLVVEMLQ